MIIIADASPINYLVLIGHLPFTGTLGILRAGAKSGLLDLNDAVARLRQTSFHVSQDVLDPLIQGRG